jgi:hypothetical protein
VNWLSSLVTKTFFHPSEKEKMKGKKRIIFVERKIGQLSIADSAMILPWRDFL